MTHTLHWRLIQMISLLLLAASACWPALAQEAEEAGDAGAETAEAEEVDHYAVPEDGDVESLLEFIRNVRRPAEPPKTRAEAMEHFRKAATAIEAATDRILQDSPQGDNALAAVREKLQALEMLQQLGDGEAGDRLEKFLAASLESIDPAIRSFAKNVSLRKQLMNWGNLAQEDRDQVIAGLRAEFASEELGPEQLRVLSMFASSADRAGDGETVIAVLEEALPRFEEFGSADVQERLPALRGVINRIRLPGNKIELEGTLVDGTTLDWESYRGKVVLVDYWATWCGPCIAELPNVRKEYERYSDKGFTVLGISLDSKKAAVEEFMAAQDLPWVTLYSDDADNNGWSHPMAVKYGINSIPRAILVDKDGIVVHMNARGGTLGEQLEKLLGPADSATTDASGTEAAAQTARAE